MTREIPLSHGHVALVDDEDFERLSQFRWRANKKDGRHIYAVRAKGGPQVWMHRVLMAAEPGIEVDHINRNGLDNRRSNLRLASRAENQRNRNQKHSGRRFKGVTTRGGNYYATIMLNGKSVCAGGFSGEVEAAAAHDVLARRFHGEFAALNFGDDRDWILPTLRPSTRAACELLGVPVHDRVRRAA